MAGLIVLKPDLDWIATGGLFDWTIEFLIQRLDDESAAQRLREIVDNNLGSLWINEFAPLTQLKIIQCLRDELIPAAEKTLPDTEHKADAVQHLRELATLAATLADAPKT
jgi:hypothetical protein